MAQAASRSVCAHCRAGAMGCELCRSPPLAQQGLLLWGCVKRTVTGGGLEEHMHPCMERPAACRPAPCEARYECLHA